MSRLIAPLWVPFLVHAFVLFLVVEEGYSGRVMAFFTSTGSFIAALALAARVGIRLLVVPSTVWMPLALSWFDVYGFLDMHSPHAPFYSWVMGFGYPSKVGFIPYALWLCAMALAGGKASGERHLRALVRGEEVED